MYAEIAPLRRLPASLDFFDYEIPTHLSSQIRRGSLVTIPFKNQSLTGLVLKTKKHSSAPKIKSISAGLGYTIPPEQMEFLSWLGNYYHYPASLLLPFFIPEPPKRRLITPLPTTNTISKHQETPTPRWLIYDQWKTVKTLLPPLLQDSGQTLIIYPDQVNQRKLKKILLDLRVSFLDIPKRVQKNAYWQAWLQAQNEKIILGNWQSLFWPYQKLRRIIVMEADNPLYHRAEQNPRLHLNDYLWKLAERHKAALHLFSLTPPIHMMLRSLSEKAIISQAVTASGITLRDTSGQNKFGLSDQSLRDIHQTTNKTLIFQNFLGSGSGHKLIHSLQALLNHEFPEKSVVTYGGEALASSRELKTADVIIATSKIFLTPLNFALTIMLGADASLARPDYLATEELRRHIFKLKLCSQDVIIETATIEHPFWQTLTKYKEFYQLESLWRKKFHYPPFSQTYKFIARSNSAGDQTAIHEIKKLLPDGIRQTAQGKSQLLVKHEILDTLIDKILQKYHNQILIEKNPYYFQ